MKAGRVDVLVNFQKSLGTRKEHSAVFGNESFMRTPRLCSKIFEWSSAWVKEKGFNTLDF